MCVWLTVRGLGKYMWVSVYVNGLGVCIVNVCV